MMDDQERLAALARYEILDTPPEAGFDDIVLLASQICETPVALVSLVDANRQWFKARIGFEPCETPLDQSVCAHAIREGDLLVIPDLLLDERTRTNTLVTQAPRIRFYAGAVLATPEGAHLGTLCVIDDKPRPAGLTPAQETGLRALARQVMAQLALRRAALLEAQALAASRAFERKTRFAMEAGRLGSWELDLETGVLDASAICKVNFGLPPDQPFTYADLRAAIHPDDRDRMEGAVARSIGHGEDYEIDYRIVRPDGSEAWLHIRAQLARDEAGTPARLAGISLDITERMVAEAQKQLLMEELAHRVKNTFAVVQAIASQTLRRADPDVAETFQSRLMALGHAHDVLLQKNWSAATLASVMASVLRLQVEAGRFDCAGPDLTVGSKTALSLSLLLHELATNAVKYGALSVDGGIVEIRWSIRDETLHLTWREQGGPPAAAPARHGFGSRLIGLGIAGSRKVDLRYRPEGLVAEFAAPMATIAT